MSSIRSNKRKRVDKLESWSLEENEELSQQYIDLLGNKKPHIKIEYIDGKYQSLLKLEEKETDYVITPTRDANKENDKENHSRLSELEIRRAENMKKNLELFREFQIKEAKQEVAASFARPSRNLTVVGLKKSERVKVDTPRRRSLRLKKIKADEEVESTTKVNELHQEFDERKPEVVEMKLEGVDENGNEDLSRIFKSWKSEENHVETGKQTQESKSYKKALLSLQLQHSAKTTKNRIYSIAVHPTTSKTIAVFGDKWGHVGIWDVGSSIECKGYPVSKEVFAFQPHSRSINCLKFSSADCNKLYSCSYDGTIRQCDFNDEKFTQVFAFEDESIKCMYFAHPCTKPNVVLIADSEGEIVLVDVKSGKAEQKFHLFDKITKCVDCHPMNENLFVAASGEGICGTWDLRTLSTSSRKNPPISSFRAPRTAATAFFSPITGNKIVYTAVDNYIRVFDVNEAGEFPIKPKWNISHNNHVGRWLTSFRATWDPKNDNVFVVGSMSRPRKVDVYNCLEEGKLDLLDFFDENLTSITSVNVFHPSKNILVGGNSSGKAFVWM